MFPLRVRLTRLPLIAVLLVSGFALDPGRAADAPAGAPAETAYRSLPALPEGRTGGRAALERSAVELAAALGAVPGDRPGTTCPTARLSVSWREPGAEYEEGAVVRPVGPPPTAADHEVNGVVLCRRSTRGFMGFEAHRRAGRWRVVAVPYLPDEEHASGGVDHEHEGGDTAATQRPAAPGAQVLGAASGPIEGYAAYEPQRTCDPTPKPGTVALRDLLLSRYGGSRNLGISRGCSIGGRSEHKEGRAFDWGVLVTRPSERAAAEAFVGDLLATDAEGNRHALARRMGVMYVIWNQRIWSAHNAGAGWRPYAGRSPHTDHVHISLSWAGAMGRTSFWSGRVDPSMVLSAPRLVSNVGPRPSAGAPAAPSAPRSTAPAPVAHAPAPVAHPDHAERERRRAAAREAERQRREAERQRIEAERRAADEQRRAEREAERQRRAAERRAAEEQRRAEHRAERERRKAEWKAEQERRRAERRGGAGPASPPA